MISGFLWIYCDRLTVCDEEAVRKPLVTSIFGSVLEVGHHSISTSDLFSMTRLLVRKKMSRDGFDSRRTTDCIPNLFDVEKSSWLQREKGRIL